MEIPKEERNRGVQEARGELLYKDRFTVFNTIASKYPLVCCQSRQILIFTFV
jgi:hypothetical protein